MRLGIVTQSGAEYAALYQDYATRASQVPESAYDYNPLPESAPASGYEYLGPRGAQTLSTSDSGFDWSKLPDLAASAITAWNTQQLTQANLELARMGKPPLSATAVAPRVNVGLDPAMTKMLAFGALGIGAFLLLSRKR